ncbi:polysaccharide biosynthesis/export family protein [Flaviaesturariibacter amylovorans]|uniref:Polysaccharide biosynthesis/export family protein n=1 Tax=Flaviaesturariibacter amylovorans TaxID=1084520 RepID=A0ABP8GRR1_9BACT
MSFRFASAPHCLALLLIATFCSCVNTKKVTYLNDVPAHLVMNAPPIIEQRIAPSDILNIQVTSPNPEATAIFNAPGVTTVAGTNNQQTTGYLVDSDGYLQFPLVGRIRAAGLTKKEFTDTLRNQLIDKKLLLDPVVAVRFLNFRVTVLGEVARPTVVPVPNEKISLLEAIGMAGDLTIFGRRDNILLIREEGGQRTMHRINLNSKDLFSSEYYYLRNGDIVYAEPNKAKVASATNSRQLLPIILSGLSFVAIIFDRATR